MAEAADAAPAAVDVARDCFVRLRFKQAAAEWLTDEEDLDSVDELKELDDRRVERIVARIVKPGGAHRRPPQSWDFRLGARLV